MTDPTDHTASPGAGARTPDIDTLTGLPLLSDVFLERMQRFGERWYLRSGNEQQLSQTFLLELCDALDTSRPGQVDAGADSDYCFEYPVKAAGVGARGRVDLYKAAHFILEAKCGRQRNEQGAAPVRGTMGYLRYIEKAFQDQARLYASVLPNPPPAIMVIDIGYRAWIWPRTEDGYGGFHSPHRYEVDFQRLGDLIVVWPLWACFERPELLDPARHTQRITEVVAEKLARLAADLGEMHEPEAVARFLMRCLFCMFAEDTELLPVGHFTKLLRRAVARPAHFAAQCVDLFTAMDTGGSYDWEPLRRFNGALFRDATALPLTAKQLALLVEAADMDWADVEPAIFGTLLERALIPSERSRLGAHYTPRSFVERLVRPTIEAPLRAEWDAVQIRVAEILDSPGDKGMDKAQQQAARLVRTFRARLSAIRVLDPACGTGNFLYVSYAVLKDLEHEVLQTLRTLGSGQAGLGIEGGQSVVPSHFLGIEKKPWAAEIAQLVLWIGHLQWLIRHEGVGHVPQPVLGEQRSIVCDDALIQWTSLTDVVDDGGEIVQEWDGVTTQTHPISGKQVPDLTGLRTKQVYGGVTQTPWPEVDFIVGNPPFIGNKVMRQHLGDGYVDAVRRCYGEVPETVDYVVYWWHRAAQTVRTGGAEAMGFITTNSLRQTQNRQVLQRHLEASPPLRLSLAVADHPWVDRGANVRISMTVGVATDSVVTPLARLGVVTDEAQGHDQLALDWRYVPRLHADLSGDADLSSAKRLQANEEVSFQGMNLVGKGFRLEASQITELGFDVAALPGIVRPYLNAREMMQRRQHRYVIDAFGYDSDGLRRAWPSAWQWLFDHVKPEREQNRDKQRRRDWWLFGRSNARLRAALAGSQRYIATPETSKHRCFEFYDVGVCPDHTLYAIVLDDPVDLGILSSGAHTLWATSIGGRQGKGNDPRYNNTRCFKTFPFPLLDHAQTAEIGAIAAEIDSWRKAVRAAHPDIGLTHLYNIIAKLRDGATLSAKETKQHQLIATSHLLHLHERLDEAVLAAYGFSPEISDRALLRELLALNHARADEEARGVVRWVKPRPEDAPGAQVALDTGERATAAAKKRRPAWPSDPLDQIAAVLGVLAAASAPMDVEAVARRFSRARRERVAAVAGRLAASGLVVERGDGRFGGVLRVG